VLLIIRNIEKFSRKYHEVETGQAYMGDGLRRLRGNDEEGRFWCKDYIYLKQVYRFLIKFQTVSKLDFH